jgi:ribonuclease-3
MRAADWPTRWLLEKFSYAPRDLNLFIAALTHRSVSAANNERLEFLGDAVLNLLIAEQLYRAFPDASEGDLSRLRARLVSSEPLAQVATSLELGDALHLGSGELKTGGFRRKSILADALEAVCGALFLDGGLAAARTAVEALFAPRISALPPPATLKDSKTRLQEFLQSQGWPLPRYVVERIDGQPHAHTFLVSCEVAPLGRTAQGSGSTRRSAEQQAAARVLHDIDPAAGVAKV